MNGLKQVRVGRNMPFLKRGMRCNLDGRDGTLTSGNMAHVRVRFDGEKRSSVCHPKWQMTYYADDGSIVADYKVKA